jgi:PAS domain S-box-containing protein
VTGSDIGSTSGPTSGAAVQEKPVVGLEQLMALLDHTSAVIYMRALDGKYLLVNREYERLFNVRREEIVGLTDHDLFPREIADDFRANDLMAISQGSPVRIEESAPGDDGIRTYITVKFPLMDDAGRAYAICGISTDITERKRAEEEVRRLNEELEERVRHRTAELEASTRELDAFAYSVSHDLRAPLRSLAGFSEVLLEDYSGSLDEVGQGYLARIEANAARMARMIDDLLDLSRATRVELRRERVDVSAVAVDVLEELRDAEPDRDVQSTVAEGLVASGDPHLIRLIMHNLLGNAWKFTSRRAPAIIRVDAITRHDAPVFTVSDNGAGFDMRYVAKLFDPFQRLHSTTDFEGTGIGLAIVHRIVHRHGGRIWAESEPGQGATFFFTLAVSAAVIPPVSPAGPPAVSLAGSPAVTSAEASSAAALPERQGS